MKGIILAGGAGSRLYPLTLVTNKQLQAVYDKPMIYYPLTTLMKYGIKDICLISAPVDILRYQKLFGDGSQFGIKITYLKQLYPNGIAEAFIIAEKFIDNQPVTLILGDNIFYGENFSYAINEADMQYMNTQTSHAYIFRINVSNPERYGVIRIEKDKIIDIIEKPKNYISSLAVPGIYVYPSDVCKLVKTLKPSKRGELEITDLNKLYLRKHRLKSIQLSNECIWLDAGTSTSLYYATSIINNIEKTKNIKIGCPEEVALNNKFITKQQLINYTNKLPKCEYRDYLENALTNKFTN